MAVRNLNEKYEKKVALDSLVDFDGNPNDGDVGAVSTMIEANGWYGVGIEIEPAYVDVTVRRVCEATGLEATLERA